MKNFYLVICVLLSMCCVSLNAQDVVVQSFNYDSETRDSVISFPTDDHNKWEKIIMLYSMRCKDGLVSPPITGQTNVGCGEWDYSCNTYITDSTQVDSLYQVSPDFSISNFTGTEFLYSEDPTYTYYQSNLKEVSVTNVENENIFSIDTPDADSDVLSGALNDQKRMQYEWKRNNLLDAGMTFGPIHALELNIISGTGQFKNFKLRMRNGIDGSNACFSLSDWTEVFYDNLSLDATNNKVVFHTPFSWNGSSDLQVDISYSVVASDIVLRTSTETSANLAIAENNSIIQMNGQSRIKVGGDFSSINNEITLGFWAKGASSLPINTFFINGVDTSGQRQINVHLPWSNGQVYWDCGGAGSSYDRINTTVSADVYKENWTYWTFTKNAATGSMKMYINGSQALEGTGKFEPIDLDSITIGTNASGATPYYGDIDDIKIWNRELNGSEIRANLCGHYAETNDAIVMHYDFDNADPLEIQNQAGNDLTGSVVGSLSYVSDFARDFKLYDFSEAVVPVINPIQADYTLEVNERISLDSVLNSQHQVIEYILDGTDRIEGNVNTYFPAGDMPIYDEEGNIVATVPVSEDGVITIGDMEHYTKSPMQMELMSFVTPYGINLDLGWEGKTWTFDVTDFGPILKGDRRMFMSRGGQWQEDMDIKFLFYEGTPIRNVNSIQQIWPVTSTGFQNILDDVRFEPRDMVKTSDDDEVLVKTVVTGHGQDGEFVPRQHFIAVNDIPLQWSVWKECSSNPIYPQGGTWVYDRAGWCPGEASDQQVYNFTGIMQDDVPIKVDYGISAVSGQSNYIVNSQLVKYGPANFNHDAAIHDIIYPSDKIEYGRFNPNCGEGRIVIQNRGAELLSSATIVYGFEGGSELEQEWTGNLPFMATEEVILRYIPDLAASSSSEVFYVKIINMNGDASLDQYQSNDRMESTYLPTDMISSEVVVNFRTNNNAQETTYKIYDEFDQVIFSKGPGGLSSNSTYFDTLNLNGCYRLEVRDLGQDGLEWWANPNQGAGYIRITGVNGGYNTFDPDFGGFLEYNFVAGMVTSTNEVEESVASIEVFPNPSNGLFKLIIDGMESPRVISVLDNKGSLISSIFIDQGSPYFHSIDLSDQPAGMYYLKVEGEKDRVTKKIMKL